MRIAHAQFPLDVTPRAGCSTSSLSDSLASGTTFTTVSSDGEDIEDSREDASEISSRTSAELENILSRLKAADHSGLCRKGV